jgi:hypothetical protein
MTIRVIRILEYEFRDAKAYEDDRYQWTHGVEAHNMTMRCAVLSVEFLSEEGTDLVGRASHERDD